MSARTVRTDDGVKLTTASQCRYVVFNIWEGKGHVFKRSNSLTTAHDNVGKAKRHFGFSRRVVLVDFAADGGTVLVDR